MKIFRLFSIAAAALMMAACSTEDSTQQATPGKLHFTATIAAPGSGATTRTEYTEVTTGEAAGTINVVWKAGDEIALIHNGKADVVKVETVNEDGSATITGDITVGTNGEAVTAYYPAAAIELNSDKKPVPAEAYTANLLAQDGTLSYIASNLDLRVGESTLAVDGDKATLSNNVSLTSNTAIWKLTLQDNAETPAAIKATQVSVIKDGETPETLAGTSTLSTATSTVYLAMPEMAEPETTVTIEAATADGTYIYENSGLTLAAGNYYQSTVTMAPAVTDLSKLTANYTAQDGDILTGTLGANVKISIADDATVTLDGVTINGVDNESYKWAGITCDGDAIIILKGTNTVKGFYNRYPGIHPRVDHKLTIKGTGSLTASSNAYGGGAGIGGGMSINCGNIEIQGGVITAIGGGDGAGIGSGYKAGCGSITISGGTVNATGGEGGAGIGSGHSGSCGDITISGGTVTANGGNWGAGIGSGYGNSAKCDDITISGGTVTATGGEKGAGIGSARNAKCDNITITTGVTQVTATKGNEAPNSIGAGNGGTCGTVTIGCTLDNDGNPVGGTTGAISTSPYTYPLTYPVALSAVTSDYVGSVVTTDGNVYATAAAATAADKTAAAMIAYVSSTGHGLALALADESSAMNWSTAITTAAAHTPTVTGGTWKLATKDEWTNMITAAGSYTALRDGFTSVGGSNLDTDYYWSSTEYENDTSNAWMFLFSNGSWDGFPKSMNSILVRACLAF